VVGYPFLKRRAPTFVSPEINPLVPLRTLKYVQVQFFKKAITFFLVILFAFNFFCRVSNKPHCLRISGSKPNQILLVSSSHLKMTHVKMLSTFPVLYR
jgi:hypothetical protein